MSILDWGRAPCRDAIRSALEVLHHRGPDSSTIWQSPGGQLALGQARLGIIDLPTGAQPIPNEDESIQVIVNGEFYDFEEIRANLESLGHRFRTRSDSEILVHLYEQFGLDCLNHLRGEFAFVLWDERKQRLFAARDRFGIKPLFYSHRRDGLYLASEVKALHAAGVELAWDEESFFEKLTVNIPLQGRTLFRNIRELPPAHYLLVSRTESLCRPYWDFNFPSEVQTPALHSDDEYAEQFLAVLDDAVRVRLRADVPIACYLSGGIDSCSVLGLAQRRVANPIAAFSVTFDHEEYDESAVARDMAKSAGAEFIPVPVTQADLAIDFEQAVWNAETLFMNAHAVAKFKLSRAVHKAGLKVVLTGDGSDEILGGYPAFVKDSIRHAGPSDREMLGQALGLKDEDFNSVLQRSIPSTPAPFMRRLGYVPATIEAQECVLQLLREALPNSFRSDEIYTRLLDSLDLPGQLNGRAVLNQSLYLHCKTMLPGYTLPVVADRMEMAHSVEGRPPFLDHRVVEFARSLPPSQKIRGTAEKFILRKAMRTIVTPSVCGRRKQPFMAPPALLNPEQPLNQLMQDTLRGTALDNLPFIDKEAVRRILDVSSSLNTAGRTLLETPLMLILSACVLGRRFKL